MWFGRCPRLSWFLNCHELAAKFKQNFYIKNMGSRVQGHLLIIIIMFIQHVHEKKISHLLGSQEVLNVKKLEQADEGIYNAVYLIQILLIQTDDGPRWAHCIYTGYFIIISVIQTPKVQPAMKYSDKFIGIYKFYCLFAHLGMVIKHSLACSQLYVLRSWLLYNDLVFEFDVLSYEI